MPTYTRLPRFDKDFARLSDDERAKFRAAVEKFVVDLKAGKFRSGLRVKGVEGAPGIYEMTWAPDARATFEYGPEVREGEPHVIWRRCGGHEVFGAP